jgi:hypothetical protein
MRPALSFELENMILFNEQIVAVLNEYFSKHEEYVESVLLASHGFSIQFVSFSIHCNERVFASIKGSQYEWSEAPNSGPWGALGRQLAKTAVLRNEALLGITFESGDSLDIETVEGQYESVVFRFPPQGNSLVIEIF